MEIENTPAGRIIKKFGTAYKLSKAIGVEPQTVYRWTYPKDKGGADGVIPLGQHQRIYDAAKRLGIRVTLEDFSTLVTA